MRALSKASKKITIQTLSTTVDDLGGLADSWNAGVSVWAERENTKGSSGYDAEREFADADAVFTIRLSTTTSAFTPYTQRIVVGSETFDIVGIVAQPANRPETLELFAKRRI